MKTMIACESVVDSLSTLLVKKVDIRAIEEFLIGAAADRKLDHPAFLKQIAPDDGLLALDFAMRRTSSAAPFERAQLAVLAADWSLLRDMSDGAGDQRLFTELTATVPVRRDGNDNNTSNASRSSPAALNRR
jgi:hypothetical protein